MSIAIVIVNCVTIYHVALTRRERRDLRASRQTATCQPVYHTRLSLHTIALIAERQARKLLIPIFIVFGLARQGTEPESTASVGNVLSTLPLIFLYFTCLWSHFKELNC